MPASAPVSDPVREQGLRCPVPRSLLVSAQRLSRFSSVSRMESLRASGSAHLAQRRAHQFVTRKQQEANLLHDHRGSGSTIRRRVSARPHFRAILEAVGLRRVDPDDVLELLLGAVPGRALVPTVVRRTRSAEPIVDLVVRALRPHDPLGGSVEAERAAAVAGLQ